MGIFEVLGEFWRGLEESRSDKIYSSGNRGVKKGPGPRGSRDEEFLVPSLIVHQGFYMTEKSFLDRFSGLYGIHRMFFMSFPIFSSTSFLIKFLSYVSYITYPPSSIYSWFLKSLPLLHSRFPTKKSWVVAYFFNFFQLFQKKKKL